MQQTKNLTTPPGVGYDLEIPPMYFLTLPYPKSNYKGSAHICHAQVGNKGGIKLEQTGK